MRPTIGRAAAPAAPPRAEARSAPAGTDLRRAALVAQRAGRMAEARRAWRAHLARRPEDAAGWSNLGALLRRAGEARAALICQRRARALAPGDADIEINLANALHDADALEEALELRRGIARRAPEAAEPQARLASALRALNRPRAAAEAAEAALARHPGDPALRLQLGLARLSLGDWAAGFEAYAARWETGELRRPPGAPREWRGETPPDGRLLVMPEQGLGDALLASRFLAPLKARLGPEVELVLAVRPGLRRLFEGMAGVDRLETAEGRPPPAARALHMLEAPRRLFLPPGPPPPAPALHVPAEARARAAARLAPFAGMLRVGVCWAGSPAYAGDAKRSLGPERFLPLAEIPGVQLFSLYKGPGLAAFRESGAGAVIADLSGDDRDLADAAAAIEALDLVITVDTAIAHLAGTLGRPVWTLLGYAPFWAYGAEGETTPWHPSMRLFRQSAPGDWDGVMARAAQALRARLEAGPGAPDPQGAGAPGPAPPAGDASAAGAEIAEMAGAETAPPEGIGAAAPRDPDAGGGAAPGATGAAADRPEGAPRGVMVEVSPGELVDRITILEIKAERLPGPAARRSSARRLAALTAARDAALPALAELDDLAGALREVNADLWVVEDDLRAMEGAGEFGPDFIALARSVYRLNDRRARLKREIDLLLGAPPGEEKSHPDC